MSQNGNPIADAGERNTMESGGDYCAVCGCPSSSCTGHPASGVTAGESARTENVYDDVGPVASQGSPFTLNK